MKQKIVIRVNDGKSRCKTLKTVVCLPFKTLNGGRSLKTLNGGRSLKTLRTVTGVSGVESAAIKGDQVEVVGDGIDAVCLTRALRKNVAPADLISVEEHKKKEEKKDDTLLVVFFPQSYCPMYEVRHPYPDYLIRVIGVENPSYEVRHPSPDRCCTTMTTVMCLLCMTFENL